ncbi:hypothetical protein CEXT_121641 [Caerostris extrusa]|uniref:Uncharacterized protein n=1 Tax=Caerostris extrusa TaxID=172846 RepID=A0AAV4Q5G0_CAEEX|nr:hypothetical protein CEXT_121641 [Caerostris extrusa]
MTAECGLQGLIGICDVCPLQLSDPLSDFAGITSPPDSPCKSIILCLSLTLTTTSLFLHSHLPTTIFITFLKLLRYYCLGIYPRRHKNPFHSFRHQSQLPHSFIHSANNHVMELAPCCLFRRELFVQRKSPNTAARAGSKIYLRVGLSASPRDNMFSQNMSIKYFFTE